MLLKIYLFSALIFFYKDIVEVENNCTFSNRSSFILSVQLADERKTKDQEVVEI